MADGNGVLARLLSLEVALTRIETLAVGSKSHDFFGHGLAHGRPWPMAMGPWQKKAGVAVAGY